jgi:hypothetical protein
VTTSRVRRLWGWLGPQLRGRAGNEESVILERLRCNGAEVEAFEAPAARAYLYDLAMPSAECGVR